MRIPRLPQTMPYDRPVQLPRIVVLHLGPVDCKLLEACRKLLGTLALQDFGAAFASSLVNGRA